MDRWMDAWIDRSIDDIQSGDRSIINVSMQRCGLNNNYCYLLLIQCGGWWCANVIMKSVLCTLFSCVHYYFFFIFFFSLSIFLLLLLKMQNGIKEKKKKYIVRYIMSSWLKTCIILSFLKIFSRVVVVVVVFITAFLMSTSTKTDNFALFFVAVVENSHGRMMRSCFNWNTLPSFCFTVEGKGVQSGCKRLIFTENPFFPSRIEYVNLCRNLYNSNRKRPF